LALGLRVKLKNNKTKNKKTSLIGGYLPHKQTPKTQIIGNHLSFFFFFNALSLEMLKRLLPI
jgi:hypothetical protein